MWNFWQFLTRELSAAPGRGNYTLRLTLSCAVLITLFMALQIPFLAVALIVVFYVSQPNVLMIKLVSVVFFITVSVALGGVILIIKWTYDYPLIRLVASVFLFFCSMYLMRILGKLGMAFFVMGLVVIYAQTFPSMTSQSEVLVRLLLWLWVAINTAILVTLLVNACFLQAFPGYQFKSRLALMFREAGSLLAGNHADTKRPTLKDIADQFTQLQSLYKQANRSSSDIAARPQAWQSMMGAAVRCYHLAVLLQPMNSASENHAHAQQLSAMLGELALHLDDGKLPDIQPFPLTDDTANGAILREISTIVGKLARGEEVPLPAGDVEKEPLLAPDAWSNPTYLHFALKTLLATLLCYVFYTAADWQGIHTIMLSCVIVAQPGLGATMQKTWLRIGGALIATLLALLLLVFIQPYTDSIIGLLAMSLPVMALSAWIAAGSDRIAYAGIQIGFTFSLAFLNWFGPLTNLTELRDRVIGILLGVLVSSIVHLYLWPESEAPKLKSSLARLYNQAAKYLAARGEEVKILPLFHALATTESLINRVAAEPINTYAYPYPEVRRWPVKSCFNQVQEVVRLSEGYRLYAPQGDDFLQRCAARLQDYANSIEQPQVKIPSSFTATGSAGNPFGPPLTAALAMLPHWHSATSDIQQQANQQ